MRYSSIAFSSDTFSSSTLDESLPSTVEDLIKDQEFPRTYLFRATPYNPVTEVEVEVRASLGIVAPILDNKHWPAILNTTIQYTVDLFSGDWESPQGRTSIGNIELSIGDGDYDYLFDYYWPGRFFEILLGAGHFDFSEYRVMVSGTISDVIYSQRKLILSVRGKEYLLDKDVQDNTYRGTGSLEGTEDLTGVQKPIAYGEIFNYTPILVDPDRFIYQIHDGEIPYNVGDIAVYDGGAPLLLGQYTSDILGTPVAPGYYTVQPVGDGSYIRLGAPPEKNVTVDFKGEVVLFGMDAYHPKTLPDILKELLISRTNLADTDLDLGSFDYINNHPFVTDTFGGLVLQNESVIDVINYIMRSLFGAWTFTASGKMKIALFEVGYSVGEITESDIIEGSLRRENTIQHPYKLLIGYNRNWTVQADSDLLGDASEERRVAVSREYAYLGSHSYFDLTVNEIQELWPTSKKLKIDTCFSYQGNANAAFRLSSRIGFLGTTIDENLETVRHQINIFSFEAKLQQFKYEVGQTITIVHSRFGLGDGKIAIIMSISENTSTGRTKFICWACPRNTLSAL